MLKKLFQLLFSTRPSNAPLLPPVPEEEKSIQVHLDTGKIIFPDNISPEDRKELEEALAELNESLQKFAPEEIYKSLEDFLAEGGNSGKGFPLWEGIITVNDEDNSLAKVVEQMEFCDDQTEHWSDMDFAERLFDLESQGYDFTGIEQIYKKLDEKIELTSIEKKRIRDCYKLVTQEFVYGV